MSDKKSNHCFVQVSHSGVDLGNTLKLGKIKYGC